MIGGRAGLSLELNARVGFIEVDRRLTELLRSCLEPRISRYSIYFTNVDRRRSSNCKTAQFSTFRKRFASNYDLGRFDDYAASLSNRRLSFG